MNGRWTLRCNRRNTAEYSEHRLMTRDGLARILGLSSNGRGIRRMPIFSSSTAGSTNGVLPGSRLDGLRQRSFMLGARGRGR